MKLTQNYQYKLIPPWLKNSLFDSTVIEDFHVERDSKFKPVFELNVQNSVLLI